MTVTPSPSPAWIDAIHARLSLAYGSRFDQLYEGHDTAHVKAAWLAELKWITSAGIAHALANLPPDFPPNAMQFKALCQQLRKETPPAPRLGQGGHVPTVDDRRRLEEAIAPLRAAKDPKAWAHALRWREQDGERLSVFQKNAWRTALGVAPGMLEASIHAGSSDV